MLLNLDDAFVEWLFSHPVKFALVSWMVGVVDVYAHHVM